MGNYYKPYKKDEKAKRVFKILGPILLAIGVVMLVVGGVFLILSARGIIKWFVLGRWLLSESLFPLIPGIALTIGGWHPKIAVYSNRGGHFEEIPNSPTVEPSTATVTVEKSTVNCRNCGTANDSTSSFCKECGKPLNLSATCSNCNAKVNIDSKYCPKCGHAVLSKAKGYSANNAREVNSMHRSATEDNDLGLDADTVSLMQRAEQGDAEAQYALASNYLLGEGIEKSYTEAFKWFMKAAEQGHRLAMCNVSNCYNFGYGVEKNAEEAHKWLQMAQKSN